MVAAVRARSMPNAITAAHDVGALIYYDDSPLLDIVGLTDAEVAHRLSTHRKEIYGEVRRLIAERRPALLVVLRQWDDEFLHITGSAPDGTFRRVWSSIPNSVTGVVYDLYECRWP
jgi:hypothetical protein